MRKRRTSYCVQSALLVFVLTIAQGGATSGQVLSPTELDRFNSLDARPLQTLANVELADYLTLRTRRLDESGPEKSATDDIVLFARRAVGQRFRLNADRFDMAESDCVVFVERTLAMALATDWPTYYQLTQRLRHRDGIVSYRERNFHTLSDWLPNNKWLMEDITDTLGDLSTTFQHAVRPKVFEEFPAAPLSRFTRIVFKGSDYSQPAEIRTDSYIPAGRVQSILSSLHNGDIVLVMRPANQGYLGCNHLGLVLIDDATAPQFISSEPGNGVCVKPLGGLCGLTNVAGLKILRIRKTVPELLKTELSARAETLGSVPAADELDRLVTKRRAGRD